MGPARPRPSTHCPTEPAAAPTTSCARAPTTRPPRRCPSSLRTEAGPSISGKGRPGNPRGSWPSPWIPSPTGEPWPPTSGPAQALRPAPARRPTSGLRRLAPAAPTDRRPTSTPMAHASSSTTGSGESSPIPPSPPGRRSRRRSSPRTPFRRGRVAPRWTRPASTRGPGTSWSLRASSGRAMRWPGPNRRRTAGRSSLPPTAPTPAPRPST